jgi:hypothetical protein
MTTATVAEKTRKLESRGKGQYLTGETFSRALNKTQAMDLKQDWRGRARERGGSVNFNLLAKRPELDATSLATQDRMNSVFVHHTQRAAAMFAS